jgi:hypothetical protein
LYDEAHNVGGHYIKTPAQEHGRRKGAEQRGGKGRHAEQGRCHESEGHHDERLLEEFCPNAVGKARNNAGDGKDAVCQARFNGSAQFELVDDVFCVRLYAPLLFMRVTKVEPCKSIAYKESDTPGKAGGLLVPK